MLIENAFIAAVVFVVVSQCLRQLLPNLFAYFWQEHTCNVVPTKFRKSKWFNDENSLLYVDGEQYKFKSFSILTQANARVVVLNFGIVFWLFSSIPIMDINEGKGVLLDLLIMVFVMSSSIIYALRVNKDNTNPDVFISSFINSVSIALSFYAALLVVS